MELSELDNSHLTTHTHLPSSRCRHCRCRFLGAKKKRWELISSSRTQGQYSLMTPLRLHHAMVTHIEEKACRVPCHFAHCLAKREQFYVAPKAVHAVRP